MKRYMAISQSRAPFERGSKLVRKTIMTDSRFPGTTELLSAVRANLEEQVRIMHDATSSYNKIASYSGFQLGVRTTS